MGIAQEGDDQTASDTIKKEKLERPAFESSFIVDNPTNVVNAKNAMEIQMEHRFGIMETWDDLGGIWGAANIRLGATYGVHERVTLGIGTQKYRRYSDINAKVAILRQTRSGKMPVSLTYYGNFAYNGQQQSVSNPRINYDQDRPYQIHFSVGYGF